MKSRSSTFILVSLAAWLIAISALAAYASSLDNTNLVEAPPPGYTVAFLGDSGYGTEFEAVLTLIKAEEADLVLHMGDFDYSSDPTGFFAKIDAVLGADFPYLLAVGNHDRSAWNAGCGDADGCYADFLSQRMNVLGIVPDEPDLNDQKYAVTYQGLRMVFVGENGNIDEFAQFINDQMADDSHIWRICGWHRNQKAMQVGGKSDQMGWDVYENCRNLGAIIATAHEHSYSRTRTLINMQQQIVDPDCASPNALCVAEGKTFAFVSGLGGRSIRDQERCLPTSFPYGCNGEWASIYASQQGANYGVLFISFNVDGNPNKARGYFKTIDGDVIDSFEIIATTAVTPPTPTPTPGSPPTEPADRLFLPIIE